jgi:hypothetical protein
MPSAFTHYWSESTLNLDSEGETYDHTAGNRFVSAGVTTGDRVYGITVRKGVPMLIGRMTVSRPPLSYEEASELLDYNIWEADEHLIAEPGTASLTSFVRVIPTDILKRLRFESAGGETALKFVSETRLDQQTFRGVRRLTAASALELESLLESPIQQPASDESSEQPTRVQTLIARLKRDRIVVSQIKSLYDDACQLCGGTIELPGGGRYSEGHHIRPLGSEHRGSDSLDNLLCVCPNCHTKLDYGCITLAPESLTIVPAHAINRANIDYHNQRIFGRPLQS